MPAAKTSTLRRNSFFIPNYPKQSHSGTALGFVADFQDGSGQVVEPDTVQFTSPVITGTVVTAGADSSLVLAVDGPITLEWRGYFDFVWAQPLIFYAQVNDGDVTEVGRVPFSDTTGTGQAFVTYKNTLQGKTGDSVKLYISTGFAYAAFSWSAVQVFGYMILTRGA